jgi:putative DNA primase/helicase
MITLAGTNHELRELCPGHREELHASGLTDETIARAGIYSEADQRKLQHLLGWQKPPKMGAAIVYAYHSPDGANGYVRIKPDIPRKRNGKPIKYESPVRRPNEPYFPPDTAIVLDDASVALLFTEGEKKALCADRRSSCLAGVLALG